VLLQSDDKMGRNRIKRLCDYVSETFEWVVLKRNAANAKS
jgi:hypothetical protein